MALTLNAEQKSIYQIFSGENQYIIPPYQRAYSWTNIQCETLFEDIKKAFYKENKDGYFLGNIVLAKSREERNKLEVIDGQQRLTSLTLLLKVLLSFDKDNKALYNAIWIKDRRTDKEIQRLETNVFMEKDFNYFKEVLAFDFSTNVCNSIKEDDNLFKQNICYFYNELKEFSKHNDIFKFADFLLDYIYILPIVTEDNNAEKARKNALQVFETINNRGLDLSTSDIFKARLYSMALNELEHEEFIKKWAELERRCNETNDLIEDVFDIYTYIIIYENNINELTDIESDEFFLESKYSPFLYKKYNVIMEDLLDILNFTDFFVKVIRNPNKYLELSKWFQLVHQELIDRRLDTSNLYINFYKSNLDDYENLINISKKIICDNELKLMVECEDLIYEVHGKNLNNEEFIEMREYLYFRKAENILLLLGLYLDKNQKALYPYFIEKGLDFMYCDLFHISKKILIQFKPELEDTKKSEKLIQKAYKFIREANENKKYNHKKL